MKKSGIRLAKKSSLNFELRPVGMYYLNGSKSRIGPGHPLRVVKCDEKRLIA